MRFLRRVLFPLSLLLPASVVAVPALSQNLLVNPGFDRDLSGWDLRTEFYPPANVGASAKWDAADALARLSGSVRFHLNGGYQTVNRALLSQCLSVVPGRRYSGGGLVRTDDQLQYGVIVRIELYTSAGCAGNPVVPGPRDGSSLPPLGFTHNNSGGQWLPAAVSALAGAGAQSLRFSVGIDAVTGSYYAFSDFEGLFDDAYLIEEADPAPTWVLPSSGRGAGAGGSLWTTTLTLANPNAGDALVTVKFLGHDIDGRSGDEKTFLIRAGSLVEYPDVLGGLFGLEQGYGAIRVTSSSASLVVQSETSTPSTGGSVGQALPAFGPADYAGATPKTLAPIRENASFRTNLVLSNPTEIPITAHVILYAADGIQIGGRHVDLPPLGMTQINRVASALGASSVDAGRISVSTATPGGLVAAYASVIDNTTNDPRTLLPQDGAPAAPGTPSTNLLTNSGFDRDLTGWTSHRYASGGVPGDGTFVDWSSSDASNSSSSGSAGLHAQGKDLVSDGASIAQCVSLPAGLFVRFGAKFLIRTQKQSSLTATTRFFETTDCSGSILSDAFADFSPSNFGAPSDSGGVWVPLQSLTLSPPGTASATIDLTAWSQATRVYGTGWADVSIDDAYLTAEPATEFKRMLPSASWSPGAAGAFWRTQLTLVNPDRSDAAVSLRWLGHDVDGRGSSPVNYSVPPGEVLAIPDWVFGPGWGALELTSSSPAVFLESETSAGASSSGSVGQALGALDASDFAGATPKTLAPIRENASFRTNLVLANATEIPVTAHVILFAADGSPIGSRDVDLPPLGMTQINRVASALGAASLDAGRISVSTPTPGGLVAAYASVIANVTNDPRTLLPR